MIEIKARTVKIGKNEIIRDSELLAKNGEITVLIGRNGSGKTSLLRRIFSTRGGTSDVSVLFDGTPSTSLTPREISKKASLLPQLLPGVDISVLELASIGREPYSGAFGRLSKSDTEIVKQALCTLGIEHLADRRVRTLSGGERQLAFFASVLAKDTKNIILDEPDSALDPRTARTLFAAIKKKKSEGAAILAVMHDLTRAAAVADKIYILDGGKISPPLTPEQLKASGDAERIFGLRPLSATDGECEYTVFV